MPLSPGVRLGPYEILDALGAGGMGEVYRARDTRLERTVAIKILPQQLSNDPIRKQRFEREAKTISNLNHPHICTLHDIGSQDGVDYLVMECVEGETLAKRLEKGPLALEQVLKYGAQVADALDKAHRSGVVHRDLKPGNIMLTPTGAKLLDFGLAKPAAPLTSVATLTAAVTQSSPMTEQGAIVGTFQYMSPEQVEGKELDGRSDIFSLGAVLYEMLTGQRAFPGKSQLSVASAILEKEPAPISAVKPMTPPTLDHVIRRCLAKDPEERWQTARDLELELKWIAEGGSQAGVPAPVASRGNARERLAWASSAICFVALLGVLGATIWRNRTTNEGATVRFDILPPERASLGAGTWPALAVSPDGSEVVYRVWETNGTKLYLRDMASPAGKPIAGTEDATMPFFSPDGRWLAFFTPFELKRVPLSGGSGVTLADVSFSSIGGGTWSSDGNIYVAVSDALYRLPETGGALQEMLNTRNEKEASVFARLQALPSGKAILATVEL